MSPIRKAFLRGVLSALPMTVVVGPFALLFGVVATEAGLNVVETMLFSISVFAGASQFAALQTMQENAPVLVVLATALAVNLRMVMYSVTLAPHFGELPLRSRALMAYFLVDQSFATTVSEIDRNPANRIERAQVELEEIDPGAGMPTLILRDRLAAGHLVDVGDDHASSGSRKRTRGGRSDAGTTACDEDGAA